MDTSQVQPIQVLEVFNTYAVSFEALWQFYITVVFAVLGFVVSARKYLDNVRGIIIATAFGAFALVNWYGLDCLDQQRRSIYDASVRILTRAHFSNLDAFTPADRMWLAADHLVFDLIVVAVILYLTHNLRLTATDKVH